MFRNEDTPHRDRVVGMFPTKVLSLLVVQEARLMNRKVPSSDVSDEKRQRGFISASRCSRRVKWRKCTVARDTPDNPSLGAQSTGV